MESVVRESTQEPSNVSAKAALKGVLRGSAPWIAAGLLAAAGYPIIAQLVRLGLALAQNLQGLRARRLKALELSTFLYSLVESTLTLGFGFWSLQRFGAVASQGSLALMAFASVAAGTPFTWQYAREAWDKAYWRTPQFLSINRDVSLGFGIAFAAGSLASLAALALPRGGMAAGAILPTLFGAIAVVFSIQHPKWQLRQKLSGEVERRHPWRWKARAASSADDFDAIVVGAGIGGLTAASLLARRGARVCLLEAHDRPGGACTNWTRKTSRGVFRFDAGVHDISGLGPRGPVRALLRELDRENEIDWLGVDREFRREGVRLDASGSLDDVRIRLESMFPSQCVGLRAAFGEMAEIYAEMYSEVHLTGGVPRGPETIEEMVAFPRNHPAMMRWMDAPYREFLDRHLQDASLKNLLQSMSGYLADDPARLRVLQVAPLFGYWIDGGWYPRGGSQKLSDSLAEGFAGSGGQIRLRTQVDRIVLENNQAAGVELSGGMRLRAPLVVSNADLRLTFDGLLAGENFDPAWRQELSKLKPGPSAAMCLLGLDFVPDLASMVLGGSVGVAIPSRTDPDAAPRGCSSVALMSLVPAGQAEELCSRSAATKTAKKALCEAMIDRAEETIPGLRGHIVWREDAGPGTFARYLRTTNGSIYGFEPGLMPRQSRSCVPGLLLCGGGVFPGPGIEAAVISGMAAANAASPLA